MSENILVPSTFFGRAFLHPDHAAGECVTRKMTAEEIEKYGPPVEGKKNSAVGVLTKRDIDRVVKRRREKKQTAKGE